MHSSMNSVLFLVVFVSSFASVAFAGNANVVNNCPSDIYLWSVGDVSSPMFHVSAGANWTEPYQTRQSGGISIKISPTTSDVTIVQFEYTLDSHLWYDLSNVNGNPFQGSDLLLSSEGSLCQDIACPAGQPNCKMAYTVFNDDYATHACNGDVDLTLTFCAAHEQVMQVLDVATAATMKRDEEAVVAATVSRRTHALAHVGRRSRIQHK